MSQKPNEIHVRPVKPLLYLTITISTIFLIYTFVYLENVPKQKYCHISSILTFQQTNIENLHYKKPEITDKTKFLFPIYPYGPNNQVHSFFESLKVAEVLNRTLVLTPMYRVILQKCHENGRKWLKMTKKGQNLAF